MYYYYYFIIIVPISLREIQGSFTEHILDFTLENRGILLDPNEAEFLDEPWPKLGDIIAKNGMQIGKSATPQWDANGISTPLPPDNSSAPPNSPAPP
jgi:hypothetical protein